MKTARIMAAAALLAVGPFGVHAGERLAADVHCKPAGGKLVYDCMIMLKGKKTGAPVTGATITVKADMPSMPMAHNVKPVEGKPAGMSGAYKARLELTMHGEWALTLDVSGPARDRIIKKLQFGEMVGHGKMEMKQKK